MKKGKRTTYSTIRPQKEKKWPLLLWHKHERVYGRNYPFKKNIKSTLFSNKVKICEMS